MLADVHRLRSTNLKGKSLSIDQKTALYRAIESGKISRKKVTETYGLTKQCISTMMLSYSSGTLSDRGKGRPSLVSSGQKRAMRDEVLELMRNSNAPNKKARVAIIIKYVNETSKENDQPPGASAVSKASILRLSKELNWVCQGVQKQTTARIQQQNDYWNYVVTAAMITLLNDGKLPHMIANFDSTQIGIGELGNDKHFVLKDADWDEDTSGPIEANTSGDMVLFVKLYTMITASGELAPLIFIIARKNMAEGEFEWHEVKGLGRSGHDYGIIVFCRTRAPPERLLLRVFTEWVVKFANRQAELGDTEGGFSLTLDGERGQIMVAMETDVLDLLHENRIQCAKLAPGCTATT
jgi:hypothetical protein